MNIKEMESPNPVFTFSYTASHFRLSVVKFYLTMYLRIFSGPVVFYKILLVTILIILCNM